jgi:hypothetical protein
MEVSTYTLAFFKIKKFVKDEIITVLIKVDYFTIISEKI